MTRSTARYNTPQTAVGVHAGIRRTSVSPAGVWAVLGAVAILFQLWVFVRYANAGAAHPLPSGGYRISTARAAVTWLTQAGVVGVLAGFTCWCVRQSRAQQRVTFLTAVYFGYLTTMWTAPLPNTRDLVVVDNRYSLGLATWGPYLPGWHGPDPGRQTVSLILDGGSYAIVIIWIWAVLHVTSRVARLHPAWGLGRLAVVSAVTGLIFDTVVEPAYLFLGTYAYPTPLPHATLLQGHWYQLPMSAPLLVTVPLVMPAVLIAIHACRSGQLEWPLWGTQTMHPATRTAVSLLAGAGFANVCILVFQVGTVLFSLIGHAPATDLPSFMEAPTS